MSDTLDTCDRFNRFYPGFHAYTVTDEVGTQICVDVDGMPTIYVDTIAELDQLETDIGRAQDRYLEEGY